MLKIEAGCMHIKDVIWKYTYTDVEGIHNIVFTVPPTEKPEIGDFINNGVLVKRDGYQINSDTSKWNYYDKETWGS